MAEVDWLALAIGIMGATLLGIGLCTGRMPMDILSAEPERTTHRVLFWLVGVVYLLVAITGICLFVASVMR